MTEATLTELERRILLAAATAAPSLHNTQPWRFDVDGARVSMQADPTRQLRAVDPQGRQLLISCGAALFNLRLAAGHLGREPRVRLLPDPTDPRLLARVDVTGRRTGPGLSQMLYEAIPLRHTNRFPFDDDDVPATARDAMAEAARLEDAALVIPKGAERTRLAELVRVADCEHDARPEVTIEATAWTDVPGERRDGVPGYALGPVPEDPDSPVRDLRRGAPVPDRPAATFESEPMLAVLITREDDRGAWLRAGQALQRVLLTATVHGLSVSFLNQPIEAVALRRAVLSPGSLQGYPQMLLRIGRGYPVPPTPRRPLDEVVVRPAPVPGRRGDAPGDR